MDKAHTRKTKRDKHTRTHTRRGKETNTQGDTQGRQRGKHTRRHTRTEKHTMQSHLASAVDERAALVHKSAFELLKLRAAVLSESGGLRGERWC